MGSSQSSRVTTDDVVAGVRHVRSSLSPRDRRLFNFAKFQVAEEADLDNVEIFIDFEDQEGMTITAQNVSNPSGRVFVGYNQYDEPAWVWERRGFWRACKRWFVDCWRSLKSACKNVLAIGAGVAMKAITYY